MMIDTAGCDCLELDTSEDQSKGNKNEAIIVSCHVKNLLAAGVQETDIAVVTPYNLQVELIRSLLRESHPKVEVRSVDGFQGREKEAVVMSLVRSNKEGTVGFLSENRRLNVAVTRARRHLCVVCDTDTVGRHAFLKTLVDYLSDHGFVRTAHEFQNDLDSTDVETPETVVLVSKSATNESNRRNDSKQDSRTKGKRKPKPPPPSEEENNRRRAEYEEIIKRFVSSSSLSYSFPPNLNSFERRLIHDIANSLGLFHESQGEGKERQIIIKKIKEDEKGTIQNVSEVESMSDEESDESSGEEIDSKTIEFLEIIDNFIESSSSTYKFSTGMNSYERQLIHELAEEQGLLHESVGEGKQRTVVIHKQKNKKKGDSHPLRDDEPNAARSVQTQVTKSAEKKSSNTEPSSTGALPKRKAESGSATSVNAVEVKTRTCFIDGQYREVPVGKASAVPCESSTKLCKSCRKEILVQNFTLHSVQCEKQKALQNEQARNKTKKNEKKAKKKSGGTKQPEEEEDFDSLIAQFTKENNTCSQPQCKTPTTVIFQLCPFCRKTFCLAHHMAEVHGCGDKARQHARMMISREGVLYPGSGIPSKKPPEDKRKQMQKKLDKKLDDLGGQRKVKKSTKDKDKDKKK